MSKNERSKIAMTDDEAMAMLTESRKVQLATLNRDGSVHLATMFYAMMDGKISFWTYGASQKARNLARDPRITCLVDDGLDYFELRGVQVVGKVRIYEDREFIHEVGRRIASGLTGIPAESLEDYVAYTARKRLAYQVEASRVVSWDHRKLLG